VPLRFTAGHSGHLKKSVTVYTNASEPQNIITLTIAGEVWEALQYEPRSISFGSLTAEAARAEGLTRKITLTNNMPTPAELADIRSTSELFAVQAQTLESGKKFELAITVASPLNPGYNGAAVELSTGVPEAPRLSIPVSAYLVPDVEVTPKIIKLPANRTRSTTRKILVRNNTKSALKVSDLAVSNPAFNVTLKDTQPGVLYTITLAVPQGSRLSAGGDKVTFSTDCPTAAHVEVSVSEAPARAAHVPRSATNRPSPRSGQPGRRPAGTHNKQ
jgi:hypothetical protein